MRGSPAEDFAAEARVVLADVWDETWEGLVDWMREFLHSESTPYRDTEGWRKIAEQGSRSRADDFLDFLHFVADVTVLTELRGDQTATEAFLAEMSERTITRLRSRVQRLESEHT